MKTLFRAIAPILVFQCILALRAEDGTAPEVPQPTAMEPALLDKILDMDANGWTERLKRFENEKERKLAMLCLIDFGPAAAPAVDELIALCKQEAQPETQRWAYITLGSIGPAAKPALPQLLAAFNSNTLPPGHRAAACGAIAQIDPASQAVQRAISSGLRDHSKEVRTEAIEAAVALAPHDASVLPTLSKMLSGEDAPAAAVSLCFLGEHGIEALTHGVERGDGPSRVACAEALGKLGPDASRSLPVILKSMSRERDRAVKTALATAAAKIGRKDAHVLEALCESISRSEPLDFTVPDEPNAKVPFEFETNVLTDAGTAAVPALCHGLQSRNPAARRHLVNILAKIAPPPAEAVSDLIARVQDLDLNVRMAAAKALDTYGPVAALAHEALTQMAKTEADGSPAQRLAALAAVNVSRQAGTPRHRWALDLSPTADLINNLHDPKTWVRLESAEILRARTDDPEAIAAALIAALNDLDPRVQCAAARSLSAFGKQSTSVLNTFVQWLEMDDFAFRRAALVAIAGMGDSAKPALDAVVKTALAPPADTDKELQKTLSVVLRVIGPEVVPPLIAEFKNPDAAIRARAANALASMGEVAAGASPDFIELSKSAVDSDARAGFAGLEAMGPIAYSIAAPHLVRVLRADLFEDRRKWATWALEKIKVPADGDKEKVIDALMMALLDPDAAVCRGAHAALLSIGTSALPKLRDMLKLGEGEAPYWALRVLAHMKADPADVIPRLFEYTQPGKLPVERGVAAELLVHYAPEHPETIPVLMRVLGDREDFVARAAIRSLRPFGEKVIEPLKKLLKQRNPLLRRRALDAIESVRDPKKDD
jgi:HEAT repeat protein